MRFTPYLMIPVIRETPNGSRRFWSDNPSTPSSFLFDTSSSQLSAFGRLPNLDPYGRKLSFISYFLVDVAVVILCVAIVAVYFSTVLIRKCIYLLKKCTLSLKLKKE
ncbi:hypothetical protein OESDEN_23359 [Oesophagostomum dentatum]|uniref:Uncharacterized protein n=1 Tax=Oesophagostomum dentatum TaxID=61180 RepID=A0A0B1RZE2_OESDE|nr:hypothetical protein OESDEN_23359 [Oesophagostomum dentatum]